MKSTEREVTDPGGTNFKVTPLLATSIYGQQPVHRLGREVIMSAVITIEWLTGCLVFVQSICRSSIN